MRTLLLMRIAALSCLLMGCGGMLVCAQQRGPRDSAHAENGSASGIIITNTECRYCSVSMPKKFLQDAFPHLVFEQLDYRHPQAQKLITRFGQTTLPIFLVPAQLTQLPQYKRIKHFFIHRRNMLLLKPENAGICYMADRPCIKNRVDYFLDIFDTDSQKIFQGIRDACKRYGCTLAVWLVIPETTVTTNHMQRIRWAIAVQQLYPQMFETYITALLKPKSEHERCARRLHLDIATLQSVVSGDLTASMAVHQKMCEDFFINTGNVLVANNKKMFKILKFNRTDINTLIREQTENTQ